MAIPDSELTEKGIKMSFRVNDIEICKIMAIIKIDIKLTKQ